MSNYPTDELPLMPIFLNMDQTNAEQMWQLFFSPYVFHCALCQTHEMAFLLHIKNFSTWLEPAACC